MIKLMTLRRFTRWLTGNVGIEGILSGFRQTLEDLEALQEQNDELVRANTATMDDLRVRNMDLMAETRKAGEVCTNIRQFIKE